MKKQRSRALQKRSRQARSTGAELIAFFGAFLNPRKSLGPCVYGKKWAAKWPAFRADFWLLGEPHDYAEVRIMRSGVGAKEMQSHEKCPGAALRTEHNFDVVGPPETIKAERMAQREGLYVEAECGQASGRSGL